MSRPAPTFEELYVSAWPRLVRTAFAVTGDRQMAEDAVQTAFVKAHAAWWRVQRSDDPLAYVRRATINAALSQLRRSSHRHERMSSQVPDSRSTSFEDSVLVHDQVWRAIGALPARQRAVVVLRYYEDLTEQQIADALGCRPGTVKSQASAGLAALRASLLEEVDSIGDPT